MIGKMNTQSQLYTQAAAARTQAYAPYSRFAVGAAIRSTDGKVYAGCNVENISYPCGSCAEQGAISAMIAGGSCEIAEILILADTREPITPCGACLQRIKEFSTPQTRVILANLEGTCQTLTLSELLPYAFAAEEVKNA